VKVSDESGELIAIDEIMHYFPWKGSLNKLMLKTFFIPIPSLLIKREFLINSINWPEKYISFEDWSFLWDVSNLNPKISHTSKACFFYLIHGTQSTENRITDAQRISDFNELVVPKLISKYNSNLKWTSRLLVLASFGNHWQSISELNKNKIAIHSFEVLLVKGCSMVFRINKKIKLLISKRKWAHEYGTLDSNEIFLLYKMKLN
jgi:hypothetical protein